MSIPPPQTALRPLWCNELATHGQNLNWLWRGFLAPGLVTLLTSQWKAGKTTLAAALLARLKTGGRFADIELRPGKAIVITEESSLHWYERSRTLAFGDQVCWFCRPFVGRPDTDDWQRLVDTVLHLHAEHHFDLVLIDPLAPFLPPASENSAQAMQDFLFTLKPWLAEGLAVWLQHHPRKGRAPEGQAARGTGALPGSVDILIEMTAYQRGHPSDRRRRLAAWSRFADTPARLVLEWNAEGTDYLNHGDFEVDAFQENWRHLHVLLKDAQKKLTRKEILAHWPPDFPVPDPATLWRWLERAMQEGLVRMDGRGSWRWPYRYWLAESESDPVFLYRSDMERSDEEVARLMEQGEAMAHAAIVARCQAEAKQRPLPKGNPPSDTPAAAGAACTNGDSPEEIGAIILRTLISEINRGHEATGASST